MKNPATDCSIDIETLDTAPSAAILSIGAVYFNAMNIVGRTYVELDLTDCLRYERTVSAATLQWWQVQSESARQILLPGGLKLPMQQALQEFVDAYRSHTMVERVWAKSPSFDCVILEDALRQVDMPIPWTYRQPRDIRTLVDTARRFGVHPIKQTAVHHALKDAEAQAALVMQLYHNGDNSHVDTVATSRRGDLCH